MEDRYQKALELNEKIVPLVLLYQESQNPDLIKQIFDLLLDITNQTIVGVIQSKKLPSDLDSDMRADAFIKLGSSAYWFVIDRSDVFLTYWRTSLRNHLLKTYKNYCQTKELSHEPEGRHSTSSVNKVFIQELRDIYHKEFNSWEGKDRKNLAMVLDILDNRVLKPPHEQKSQSDLASEFGVTQSFVSRWESWLLGKIREDFQGVKI